MLYSDVGTSGTLVDIKEQVSGQDFQTNIFWNCVSSSRILPGLYLIDISNFLRNAFFLLHHFLKFVLRFSGRTSC